MNEPEKMEIIRLSGGHELIAPEVLPFEIGNALSALVKRRRLQKEEAMAAWGICQRIPVDLRAIDIAKALDKALNENIYAYDAYFIECAKLMRCPLLTLDRQMKSVALSHGIKVLEP